MDGNVNEVDWIRGFENLGALWIYEGEPCSEKPHALLTSGNHSNGYFNGAMVVRHPLKLRQACQTLRSLLRDDNPGVSVGGQIDSVWGSAMGAITIAHEMAALFRVSTGFTEKDVDIHDQKVMAAKRFSVGSGERILVVEDVATTFSTTALTIAGLEEAGAEVLPVILVLVNRSGQTQFEGRQVIALINRELPIWTPEDCPYCKVGSEAVRPKTHWQELVGK